MPRTLLSFVALALLVAAPDASAGGGRGSTSKRASAPKVPRFPKAVKIDADPAKKPQLAPPNSAAEDMKPPPLTADELAIDTITIDPEHPGTPQIGLGFSGFVYAGGTKANRGFFLQKGSLLSFQVQTAWVGDKTLVVDCKGAQIEPLNVYYELWSWGVSFGMGIGGGTIDNPGYDKLSFAIPGGDTTGWEYLWITITNPENSSGKTPSFTQCVVKRV